MQQASAFQRRKNFFERKRFLDYQAHNPAEFQNLTEPGEKGSPVSSSHKKKLPPLETPDQRTGLMNQVAQVKKNLHSDHGRKARAMAMQNLDAGDRMPIDGNGPVGNPGNMPQPPQVSQ